MTTLTEFLSTADADSATALVQARAFSEQVLKPIDERMMNERTVMGLIGMESGETFMQSLEAAPDNMIPARVKAWFKPSEAGIDVATPSAVGLIDAMAGAGAITEAEAGVLKGYAYNTVTPFSNATLYDIIKSRESLDHLLVGKGDLRDGYLVVKLTASCERYSAVFEAKNPRTGEWQPANVINSVEAAGKYECKVPQFCYEWEKRLENPHGLFEVV